MNTSEPLFPRIVAQTKMSQLYTATHLTLSLPTPLEQIHSIAVLPGLAEHSRVISAIRTWEAHEHMRHFLVAGTNKNEIIQPQLTLETLQSAPFNLQRTEGASTQVEALHTRVQTDWIIQQVKNESIQSLVLFVSHWHMPRAYRTILRSMLNAGIQIPIFPIITKSSPDQIVPEVNKTVEELSAGEAERILKYEELGEIASFSELTQYLNWLWKQDVVRIYTD